MASEIQDVVVVGAGPSGLTAGIYSARAGLRTLILERAFPGGQVTKTDIIENYPGFPQGITGLDLAELMQKQATRFGAEIRLQPVQTVIPSEEQVVVRTDKGELRSRALILATGSEPRLLGVPGESQLYGRGVSTCAVCDGALFRNRTVAVVGGGDSALGAALYLAKLCSRVYLIHRRSAFRAAKVLQDRVLGTGNIEPLLNGLVQQVRGANRVEAIEIMDRATQACRNLAIDGLFVYVGESPNTLCVKGVLKLDNSGYVITDENLCTSHPLIFACGDCRRKTLRQVSTAVGDGALAASAVENLLALGIRPPVEKERVHGQLP